MLRLAILSIFTLLTAVPAEAAGAGAKLRLTVFKKAADAQLVVPGSEGPGVWADFNSTDNPTYYANQGDSGDYGYSDKPVAQWDTVPYQEFTGDFYVGVVAFKAPTATEYAAGIKSNIVKVSFSVNNGPWTDVTAQSVNPLTGVNGYVAKLQASDFTAGQIELRAIAWPSTGVPRILQGAITSGTRPEQFSLKLYADATSSLVNEARYVATTGSDSNDGLTLETAKLTLSSAKDSLNTAGKLSGGTIYLAAGTYCYGCSTENFYRAAARWVLITPAPGVAKEDVIISGGGGSGGLRTQRIHLKGLTINNNAIRTSTGGTDYTVWLDDIAWTGVYPTSGGPLGNANEYFNTWTGGQWVTDSSIQDGLYALNGAYFIRGVAMDNIVVDALYNPSIAIDVTATNITAGYSSHPDLIQWTGQDFYNVVILNFTAETGINAPGPFLDDQPGTLIDGYAIVDSTFIANEVDASRAGWNMGAVGYTAKNGIILNTHVKGNSNSFQGSASGYNNRFVDSTFGAPGTAPTDAGVSFLP